MENVSTDTSKVFQINPHPVEGTDQVVGRSEAVQVAKRLSQDEQTPVRVKRLDGEVEMEFRDGSMVRYAKKSGRSRSN